MRAIGAKYVLRYESRPFHVIVFLTGTLQYPPGLCPTVTRQPPFRFRSRKGVFSFLLPYSALALDSGLDDRAN